MRRSGFSYFAWFNLIIVSSLCTVSCTPSASNRQATRTPAVAAATATPAVTVTVENFAIPPAEIDSQLAQVVEEIPLAGLAVGIHYKEQFYEQGYGLANLENGTPVTAQTKFRIASLTKSFTAAAILRLSEEGTLSIDDPISTLIPGVPDVAKDIRVRHLLNHTSGLPDWSLEDAQKALPEAFTTAQAVEYYFGTVKALEFEPGEARSYSNAGYFLLGAIIENTTGMPYDEYFKKTFFEPLELHSTEECSQTPGLSGYHFKDKQLEATRPSNLKLLGAAGALCSTVGDLLRWLGALAHGQVVQPETWQQMITPQKLSSGEILEYGFGFVVQENKYGLVIGHEGATTGFNSYFAYYPEHELSIVLLSNTDDFAPRLSPIASSLVADLLQE